MLTGPLAGACPAIGRLWVTPAVAEWAYWVGGGISSTRDAARTTWSPTGAVGAEMTFDVARYRGFPARPLGSSRLPADELGRRGFLAGVRVGPWAAGEARDGGALVEGGASIQVDGTNVRWSRGGFGLRLGAGYGAFGVDRLPHAAATLTYGFHTVPARNTHGGACNPPIVPRPLAEAAFARVFVTHRRALAAGETWEVAFGVEITPTWLFRPLRQLIAM